MSSKFRLDDFEIGDLVILLHSIEWPTGYFHSGELAIVILVYDKEFGSGYLYDCKIKLKCGSELDVWFAEIHKLR